MDKLKMQTANKADENFKKLAAMFPNAVTETIDENGEVVRAIDKDVLMQEINTKVVDGRDERYQFTWPDKKKAMLLSNAPISDTLRPCREESVNFDDTENLYIEGDNLNVLKLLQETYLGKIRMIYIDPPYNTGNDFVYNDEFVEEVDDYLANSGQYDAEGNRLVKNTETNGRFHTDWLNMIYPRLKLAKDLLSDDGIIFISIDCYEQENLKKVCDEIFGAQNFMACVSWHRNYASANDVKTFSNVIDYVLIYSKTSKFKRNLLPRTEKQNSLYKYDSNDGKGRWRSDNLSVRTYSESYDYPITNPNTGVIYYPPKGRCWITNSHTMQKWIEENRVFFGQSGDGAPQLKRYLNEVQDGVVPTTYWGYDECGHNDEARKEVKELFENPPFESPKPTKLLQQIIRIGSDKDSIILDFFSGSATTAHAVMQINAEDGGNRKFIMVQLPEPCDEKSEAYKAGYKNICEIGKERIRRAGKKIVESLQLSVTSCEEEKDGKLQGAAGMAEINGNGERSLLFGEETAEGRTVCTVRSDEEIGGISSIEHSGGAGTDIKERVLSVSEDSKRFKIGTGNPASDLCSSRLSYESRNPDSNESSFRNRKNDNSSNENAGNSKLKTGNSKLKTDNSKLKTDNSKLKTDNSKLKTDNSKLKTDNSKLDAGFRVLKCDSSNMKDVYYNPADVEQQTMFDYTDNIKEDRTPEDLLFQVMLDLGVLLSSKIEEKIIAGKKVFNVADGFLIACFDENVTDEVITEIAKQKPYYFVMRDSSLANDSVATNFEQIFAAYSPETVRKII